MKKLFLSLFILALVGLCTTAFAASMPGQQNISYISDETGYVTSLTDDNATTAWTKQSSYGADLTLHMNYASVGEIWIRNGYAYTQNWYNHYDRASKVKVTVYYYANQYTESYDTYRYNLTDAFRPSTVNKTWNGGYQRLLLPKQYRSVTKIELTVEGVVQGSGRTGATISDIIVASGSFATATPKSYATATPRPYIVYVTPTPGPVQEEDDYVEAITPYPDFEDEHEDRQDPYDNPYVELITPPAATKTPAVTVITPTPKPVGYPSEVGVIGYANERIPTRSGPGTGYEWTSSYYGAGHQVKVTSKCWDDNNDLYWYLIEFEYEGEWYRLYTTEHSIDADTSTVPVEPQVGDPLDTRKGLAEHAYYYGPGDEYAVVEDAKMVVGKRCDVYLIENEWALVEYMDYAKDVARRAWVPVNVLYEN